MDTVKIVVLTGVGIVAVVYARKKILDWRKQDFVERYAHVPDVQAAMIMRKAMFRVEIDTFPFNYITIPDGTNEAMLNSLALKVSSVENVIHAYKILFDSNLILDVSTELNDNEMQRFYENLGAKSEYQTGFNANGTPKSQTPFKVGQTLEVKNPFGTTIYKAEELENGLYRNTNEKRDFLKFSETVGEILHIYRGVSGQYYYVMDMDWSADLIFGHGWVAHTEVKLKV
jgi:hypothetical protein